MERKVMKVNVAKKLLEGNEKGKVFLTKEGKAALTKITSK